MKTNAIIFRQNRVVYTLMVLLAALGLTWAFWEHDKAEPTPSAVPGVAKTPANQVGVWQHK